MRQMKQLLPPVDILYTAKWRKFKFIRIFVGKSFAFGGNSLMPLSLQFGIVLIYVVYKISFASKINNEVFNWLIGDYKFLLLLRGF
jgi:hypothetical protein